ncbi:hypothetical protein BO94DRAFT_532977 [Aspergillus sclerotioniger CBS 115572]|uniref:Uncharacterized protein n=1 Tax=Aspergillus sclerotioniger CBS 115572 TaxID=1450535 RepID=A0A317X4X4_9EURO|nr:hypothetical protein BO94DRAFT_532977 [Aspergillus sclerotioniger CBS 115572]PWY93251.1 hypothetical protein BO94DRAFT_532977 [Aspergillus sclerotioniger CBS 115572]
MCKTRKRKIRNKTKPNNTTHTLTHPHTHNLYHLPKPNPRTQPSTTGPKRKYQPAPEPKLKPHIDPSMLLTCIYPDTNPAGMRRNHASRWFGVQWSNAPAPDPRAKP